MNERDKQKKLHLRNFRIFCLSALFASVCVLHTKPFGLPVDIQHNNQCPCLFFSPREMQVMWPQNYATEILHWDVCSKQSRQCNALSSYWIPDTTGTTYIFYEREKTNETKAGQKIENESKEKKETSREELTCLPAGDVADT